MSGDDCTGGVCPQPITLGALIRLLEGRPADQEVRLGFGYLAPTGVESYRGFYDHLAIGFEDRGRWGAKPFPTVAEILKTLRDARGAVFTGYKGGDYVMDDATPMWVANRGESGSTAVVGLAICGYTTVIQTAYCEDWAGGDERARQILFGGGVPRQIS